MDSELSSPGPKTFQGITRTPYDTKHGLDCLDIAITGNTWQFSGWSIHSHSKTYTYQTRILRETTNDKTIFDCQDTLYNNFY